MIIKGVVYRHIVLDGACGEISFIFGVARHKKRKMDDMDTDFSTIVLLVEFDSRRRGTIAYIVSQKPLYYILTYTSYSSVNAASQTLVKIGIII